MPKSQDGRDESGNPKTADEDALTYAFSERALVGGEDMEYGRDSDVHENDDVHDVRTCDQLHAAILYGVLHWSNSYNKWKFFCFKINNI